MTRYVGGECLPTSPSTQERQEAQARQAEAPSVEGACADCHGRGYLTALCTCTRGGRQTPATAECRHCGGRGFVHTTCFCCDGSGTTAGAAEARARRDREERWAHDQHASIVNALNRLRG